MARAVVAVLVLATVLLLGCGGGSSRTGASAPAATSTPAATGSPSGYAVVVRDGGRAVGRFDVAALRAMPQTDVATPMPQGKQTQRGPRVRTVLARAGVQRFARLTVIGMDATGTFASAEIDDQVVLDFDKRGTVKLAGAHLLVERWVRGVVELDASR